MGKGKPFCCGELTKALAKFVDLVKAVYMIFSFDLDKISTSIPQLRIGTSKTQIKPS